MHTCNYEPDEVCLSGFERAKEHALIDSTSIGANIIEVVSVEVARADVILVGRLPISAMTQGRDSGPGRLEARVRSVNAFHGVQTYGKSLGFLVVQPPITLVAGTVPDEEIVHVALRLPIREALRLNITTSHDGPVCCRECNEIIPPERLRAVKNARYCVKCQEIKETSYR